MADRFNLNDFFLKLCEKFNKKILKEIFNDNSFDEITCEDFNSYSIIKYGTPYNFIVKIGKITDFNKLYKNKKEQ